MTIEIKIWSDFVCPFCMIAEKPLLDAVRESACEVTIHWMPFELRPPPTPTLRPEESYLQTVWPQSVYPLAEHHGVPIKLPSVSPQPHSQLAWEGYQFALERNKGNAYNDRLLKAFFQEDQDIGDVSVLTRLATEIGLDPAEFRTALEQHTYLDRHRQALRQAHAMGVTSVPTILIGPHRFSGVQSKQALLHAIRQASLAENTSTLR